MSLPGSLWRTGSSMAVYAFRAPSIAPYRPLVRDRILLSILYSPKHGPLASESLQYGQVNGNPSKDHWACIIGRPGEGHPPLTEFGMRHLPGPLWADDGQNETLGKWDVICRMAQMKDRKDRDIDRLIQWHGESSEVLSVVAHSAVSSASTADPLIPPSHLSKLVREALEALPEKSSDSPVLVPIRILLTHTERVVIVHVPVDPSTMTPFSPLETAYDRYCTTFNDSPGRIWPVAVEPEVILDHLHQLPTGRVLDEIRLPGNIPLQVSIVQPLPGCLSILVDQYSLTSAFKERDNSSTLLPDDLSSHPHLASILLEIRKSVLSILPGTTSTPTICFVKPMHHDGYTTLDNQYLCSCQADLVVDAFTESGKREASLPESILLALAVAQGLEGSVAYRMWIRSQASTCGGGCADQAQEILGGEFVNVYAAHPSGTLEAQAKYSDTNQGRRANSVRLKKTPFELMRGEFFFPQTLTLTEKTDTYDENEDYECPYGSDSE